MVIQSVSNRFHLRHYWMSDPRFLVSQGQRPPLAWTRVEDTLPLARPATGGVGQLKWRRPTSSQPPAQPIELIDARCLYENEEAQCLPTLLTSSEPGSDPAVARPSKRPTRARPQQTKKPNGLLEAQKRVHRLTAVTEAAEQPCPDESPPPPATAECDGVDQQAASNTSQQSRKRSCVTADLTPSHIDLAKYEAAYRNFCNTYLGLDMALEPIRSSVSPESSSDPGATKRRRPDDRPPSSSSPNSSRPSAATLEPRLTRLRRRQLAAKRADPVPIAFSYAAPVFCPPHDDPLVSLLRYLETHAFAKAILEACPVPVVRRNCWEQRTHAYQPRVPTIVAAACEHPQSLTRPLPIPKVGITTPAAFRPRRQGVLRPLLATKSLFPCFYHALPTPPIPDRRLPVGLRLSTAIILPSGPFASPRPPHSQWLVAPGVARSFPAVVPSRPPCEDSSPHHRPPQNTAGTQQHPSRSQATVESQAYEATVNQHFSSRS